MGRPETIGDNHRFAVEDIVRAGVLEGPSGATYHGHVAYLSAEGSSNLSGLRSYSGLVVPSELQATSYATTLRRIRGQDRTPRDYELGILNDEVVLQRRAGLGRQLDRPARQYVVAAEALDAERLKEAGLGWTAVRDQMEDIRGHLSSVEPIDFRVVPSGIAEQVLDPGTAFTLLKNADGTERLFIEQDGLMQPALAGAEEALGIAWQTLYDQALDPEATAAFVAQQTKRY